MNSVKVSDHWQEKYDDYYDDDLTEWRRLSAIAKTDNIVNLCRPYSHARILDIGCGEGAILDRLSELEFGEELFGLEISSSAVETVEQRDIKRLVECRKYEGYDIPFDDQSFDLAVLSHVVEHLEYPRMLIMETARVARHVFIEIPLLDCWCMGKDYVPSKTGHINFYSPRTIRKLVQTCEIKVLNQITVAPSKDAQLYQSPRGGALKYFFKSSLLHVIPPLARQLFWYHNAIIGQSQELKPTGKSG